VIARIEVLDRHIERAPAKVRQNVVSQADSNILQARVAARVRIARSIDLAAELLSGAFGDNDDCVGIPLEPLRQEVEDAVRAVEPDGHFRDQDCIHVRGRYRGVARDETRVASHQFDDCDSVFRPFGFDVCAPDDVDRSSERRLEPKASIDEVDVVVDRLRHADDGDGEPPPRNLIHQRDGAAQRAVPTDYE
jgi:hypothetical protein